MTTVENAWTRRSTVDLTGVRAVQFVFTLAGGGRKQIIFDVFSTQWTGARYERLESVALKAMATVGADVTDWNHYLIK